MISVEENKMDYFVIAIICYFKGLYFLSWPNLNIAWPKFMKYIDQSRIIEKQVN